MKKPNRAIVIAHYDRDNTVDQYLYHYLDQLEQNSSYLVFVSTAKLSEEELQNLSLYCSEVIVRDNIGYDFMSYKIGLESFDYTPYDELLICNDSVYGPIYPLENLFKLMGHEVCDFWGVTDNTEIQYHLQSYFLLMKKNAIQSEAFKNFWKQVTILDSKDAIISHYEVGFTQTLLNAGFLSSVSAPFEPTSLQKLQITVKRLTLKKIFKKLIQLIFKGSSIKRLGQLNVTHFFWKQLLISERTPFIKIELLRDNPMEINIKDYEDEIQKISQYDVNLIKMHLKRMKKN